jgi:hypothetical protein
VRACMYPLPHTGEHVSEWRRANWGSDSVVVSQLVHMHLVTDVRAPHCACTAVIASRMPAKGGGEGGGEREGRGREGGGESKAERMRDRCGWQRVCTNTFSLIDLTTRVVHTVCVCQSVCVNLSE